MADLIIKPNSATGDKLILQDRAGGAVLTTADSGATIAGATLTNPIFTPGSAPGSPANGQMYYDSTTDTIKVWNGTSWKNIMNELVATGGTESTYTSGVNTYKVHKYLTSGTFTTALSKLIDFLVVAGGGGGAGQMGAGGGAGGFRTGTGYSIVGGAHTITVGAGGAGGESGNVDGADEGVNSSIGSLIVSHGGGGGGGYGGDNTKCLGHNGGSGGGGASGLGTGFAGGSAIALNPAQVTGEVTTVQGFAGGAGTDNGSNSYTGGGGGGASEVGETSPAIARGGAGGDGENNVMGMNDADSDAFLTELSVGHNASDNLRYFSGGGTGTDYPSPTYQTASKGGGGSNSVGVANTGGGGSGRQGNPGYAGGSGIVIIRYLI